MSSSSISFLRCDDPECVLALPPELVHHALGFLAARHLAALAQACAHLQRHVVAFR